MAYPPMRSVLRCEATTCIGPKVKLWFQALVESLGQNKEFAPGLPLARLRPHPRCSESHQDKSSSTRPQGIIRTSAWEAAPHLHKQYLPPAETASPTSWKLVICAPGGGVHPARVRARQRARTLFQCRSRKTILTSSPHPIHCTCCCLLLVACCLLLVAVASDAG